MYIRERDKSIKEDALLISSVIAGELESWIPEKDVERFNFEWSQLWDTNGWFTKDWNLDYFYLKRDDWFYVTVQRCHLWYRDEFTYWTVYIEKSQSDLWWRLDTQTTCHTFSWVKSLKHALYLWEVCSELFLGLANFENYFLSEEEYDAIRAESLKNSY